jgi:chaperone required for assembly of F1-ATPase
MAEWKLKRFWKTATVEQTDDGFAVLLDGRSVKTPAKAGLIVPSKALAEKIASEWDAQEGDVNPEIMPFTRAANAAIDKVTLQFVEVADLIAAYGENDLLCYRAAAPQELVDRQAAAWDPILDWANDVYGVRLATGQGVMHIAQPPSAIERLTQEVHALSPFQLTAFHDLVSLTGSLVLGFAIVNNRLGADAAWDVSRIDEIWQAEHWGQDEEALDLAETKRQALLSAAEFYANCV